MGRILLAVLILATVISALKRPWIGILAYYMLALLGPQYIWWWNFQGLRVSFYVAVFTLLGIAIRILQGGYSINSIKTMCNLWIFLLWFFVVISYFFGPYVTLFNPNGLKPEQLFSLVNGIFLFYFCATLTIDDVKKLYYLNMIIVISTVYLTYWANLQYFSFNWYQFNNGRLMGPYSIDGGSIYRDENAFAMLFVAGLPFVYYLGLKTHRLWLRLGLWCTILFGWHAVFLTGSRGGLLGIGTVTLLVILKSKRKMLVLPLILAFVWFYQWQAGSVMKERSEMITDYQGESAAETRLVAWKGGYEMVKKHPITGVGLGTYATALPDFIQSKPMVAHNTLVQFAAESGVGAGLCYLFVVYTFLCTSRKNNALCRELSEIDGVETLMIFNDASTVSFTGLMICSLFLSLNTYEIFFYLLLINNSVRLIVPRLKEMAEDSCHS